MVNAWHESYKDIFNANACTICICIKYSNYAIAGSDNPFIRKLVIDYTF